MDCSPWGCSVHGISQARILEWVAIPFCRDLPDPGIIPLSPALQADFLPTEPLGKHGLSSGHELSGFSQAPSSWPGWLPFWPQAPLLMHWGPPIPHSPLQFLNPEKLILQAARACTFSVHPAASDKVLRSEMTTWHQSWLGLLLPSPKGPGPLWVGRRAGSCVHGLGGLPKVEIWWGQWKEQGPC